MKNVDSVHKKKLLHSIPLFIIGILILVSISMNIILYTQFTYLNKGIKNAQAQVTSMQTNSKSLASSIDSGNNELSTLQKENSTLGK
jgi:peptidoglycan hydrolase CwlO-like protein